MVDIPQKRLQRILASLSDLDPAFESRSGLSRLQESPGPPASFHQHLIAIRTQFERRWPEHW